MMIKLTILLVIVLILGMFAKCAFLPAVDYLGINTGRSPLIEVHQSQ